VDHGAKVINMSFSLVSPSPEFLQAVNFAAESGVICVSSAGNMGKKTLVFPAAYKGVLGIASTNNLDVRSTFSSFDAALVHLAAPGEGIITMYPGKHYALVGAHRSARLSFPVPQRCCCRSSPPQHKSKFSMASRTRSFSRGTRGGDDWTRMQRCSTV